MSQIDWENIEALETIANQCIYKGKEVGQARAALKAISGYEVSYEDEKSDEDLDDGYNKRYMPSIKKGNC